MKYSLVSTVTVISQKEHENSDLILRKYTGVLWDKNVDSIVHVLLYNGGKVNELRGCSDTCKKYRQRHRPNGILGKTVCGTNVVLSPGFYKLGGDGTTYRYWFREKIGNTVRIFTFLS